MNYEGFFGLLSRTDSAPIITFVKNEETAMKLKITATVLGVFLAPSVWAYQSVGVLPQDSAVTGPTRVVLYGVADIGLENVNNGQKVTRVSSGMAAGSRWGLRGTEDLGGGYRAVFVLENRIEMDTGREGTSSNSLPPAPATPAGLPGTTWQTTWNNLLTSATTVNSDNAIFDRQAFVGFITPFGGFLAGRMYTPGYEIMNAFNAYGDATAGQFGQGYAGMAIRANNAIAYRIVQSGFTATLMYSFAAPDAVNNRAERFAGSTKADDFWGTNLRYTADTWDIGVGYNQNYTYRFESPTSGTVVGAQKGLRTLNLGGSVRWGDARFFAMYMKRKNDNPIAVISANGGTTAAYVGSTLTNRSALLSFQDADLVVGQAEVTNMQAYHLGVAYRIGAGTVTVGFNRADDRRPAYNADVNHYSLGYFHDLSRRTTLYGVYALADNKNKARMGLGGAGYSGGFTNNFGKDSQVLQLGIRHVF